MNLMPRAFIGISIALLARALIAPPAFGEIPLGGGRLSASVESGHDFVSTDSPLNPGNAFDVDEGYIDEARFTLGYALPGERLSFAFNDYGTLSLADGPDGMNRVGELFVTAKAGTAFLDVGKKRICQSMSYFRAPINFVLDGYSGYELRYSDGRAMINMEWFTDLGVFGLSYMPRIDSGGDLARYVSPSQDRQFLARYDATAGEYALGVAVSRDERWRIGAQASRSLGSHAEIHAELVFDERKERVELGNPVDAGYPPPIVSRDIRNAFEGVLGVAVNLSRVSVIAEYYGNQAGYGASRWDAVTDRYADLARANMSNPMNLYAAGLAMAAHCGNEGLNGRHYLMMRVSNPSTDDHEISIAALANLQDFGIIVMPTLGYSGLDNLTLKAYFTGYLGGRYTEYSLYGEDWSCGISVELWI